MNSSIMLIMVCVVSLVILRVFYCYWKKTEKELQKMKELKVENNRLASVLIQRSNQLRMKGIEAKRYELELNRIRRKK